MDVTRSALAGGAGQAVGRYLIEKFGEEFVVKLYKGQQVTFTRDHRQVAEWVARGTYPIVLAAVQSMIESYKKEGFPLVRVFPKDGPGSLLGGFSTVAMLKNRRIRTLPLLSSTGSRQRTGRKWSRAHC